MAHCCYRRVDRHVHMVIIPVPLLMMEFNLIIKAAKRPEPLRPTGYGTVFGGCGGQDVQSSVTHLMTTWQEE